MRYFYMGIFGKVTFLHYLCIASEKKPNPETLQKMRCDGFILSTPTTYT